MPYDYYRRVLCPFCASGELRAVNASLARCARCGGAMSHDFYDAFLEIRALAEAEGKHACECGHPEMRRLPDGVYRCPSCAAEVSSRTDGRLGGRCELLLGKEKSEGPSLSPPREVRNP
jgi:ribosomal protein L37AE/L43A